VTAYRLGVDVGTTFSSAAVGRDSRAEVAALGEHSAAVPTVVWLDGDGSYLVGDAAVRRGLADPGRLAREFKRHVGASAPMVLGGTPVAPERLMARVLEWAVREVARVEGQPPTVVTVCHPANWGPYRRELLQQAVRATDVADVRFITEPEAAGIYYALSERIEPGELLAVYDLGGGTFDVTVLRRTADGFEIVGEPGGVEHLGGVDFDESVLAHVRTSIGDVIEGLDTSDPAARRALARLREDCVRAKEALSTDAEAIVPVMLPGYQGDIRVTRTEFESWIRPPLLETVEVLKRTIRSAGVDQADIGRVLLVGGSSRIPLVGELVGSALGRPVALDAHPKHAIALGAALASPDATTDATTEVKTEEQAEPAPVTEPAAVPPRGADGAQPDRRRPILIGGALAAIVVAVVAAVLLMGGGGDDGSSPSTGTDGPDGGEVFEVDTGGVLPAGHMPVNAGFVPTEVALWAKDPANDVMRRTDPVTLDPLDEVATGAVPFDAEVSGSTMLVTNAGSDTVDVIDIESGEVLESLTVGDSPHAITIPQDAPELAFVANSGSDDVSIIDIADRTVRPDRLPAGAGPVDMLATDGHLFVANYTDGTVSVFDVETLTELPDSPVDVGAGPTNIVGGGGTTVWALSFEGDSVTGLEIATGRPIGAPVAVGDGPVSANFDAPGRLWVLNLLDGSVTIVDTAGLRVEQTVETGGNPVYAGQGGLPDLHVADASGRLLRIDVETAPTDPANAVTVVQEGLDTPVRVFVTGGAANVILADGGVERVELA
jgi:YVTN family beta-propeller protein